MEEWHAEDTYTRKKNFNIASVDLLFISIVIYTAHTCVEIENLGNLNVTFFQ